MINFIKRNLANLLTFIRLACVIFLLKNSGKFFGNSIETSHIKIAIILFIVICLSDFFDGKVARKLGIASVFGANFDVFTDMFFVISTVIMLIFRGLLPIWIILFIAEKTINYFITSAFLKKNKTGEFSYIKDPIGAIVSSSYFFIPMVVFILHTFFFEYYFLIYFMLIPQVVLGVISSAKRICSIFQTEVEN